MSIESPESGDRGEQEFDIEKLEIENLGKQEKLKVLEFLGCNEQSSLEDIEKALLQKDVDGVFYLDKSKDSQIAEKIYFSNLGRLWSQKLIFLEKIFGDVLESKKETPVQEKRAYPSKEVLAQLNMGGAVRKAEPIDSETEIEFDLDLEKSKKRGKKAKDSNISPADASEFELSLDDDSEDNQDKYGFGDQKKQASKDLVDLDSDHFDLELEQDDEVENFLDGADFGIDPNFGDEDPDTEKPVDDSPEDLMEPDKAEAETPQFLYREKIQEILSDFVGKIDFDNPEEVKIAREALNDIIKRSYQIHRGGSSFPKATFAERKRMFLLRELFGNNVYEHQTSLPEKTFLKFINAQGNPDRLEPSDREFLHRGKIIEILSYLPSINLDDKEGRKKAYDSLSKLMLRLWKISQNERMVVKADDVDRKNMRLLKKVFGENVFQSAYISFEDFKKAVSEKNPYLVQARKEDLSVLELKSEDNTESIEPLEPDVEPLDDDGLSEPRVRPEDIDVSDSQGKETLLKTIRTRVEEKERKEARELYWQGLSKKEQKKMEGNGGVRDEFEFLAYVAKMKNEVRGKAGLSEKDLTDDDIDALINNGYYVDQIRNLLGLGWEIPNEYGSPIFVPRFLLGVVTFGVFAVVETRGGLKAPNTLKKVLQELKEESNEVKEERLREEMDKEITPQELQTLLAYEFKEHKEKTAAELQKISTYELNWRREKEAKAEAEREQEEVNKSSLELDALIYSKGFDPIEKARREKNTAMEQANLEALRKKQAVLEEEKIKEWKEKNATAREMKNLGACLNVIERKLEVDSGASKKDLMDWVFAFADEFGFDSQKREQLEKIIDNSLAYREAAKDVMGRYSDNTTLLNNLTGLDFTPADQEKFTVSRGPLSIDVVADADILELIRASGKSDKPCGNGFTRQVSIAGKKVFVTFTKRDIEDHQKTLTHEREHVKNKIFGRIIDREIDLENPENIAKAYQNATTKEEKHRAYVLLREYFFLVREKAFQKVKREIFSMLKDGRERGYDSLFVGGHYDYLKDFREKYTPSGVSFWKLSGLGKDWKTLSDDILVKQYNKMLREALDELARLVENEYSVKGGTPVSKYPLKDIIAMLRFVPLEKWNEYVGNLLATAA